MAASPLISFCKDDAMNVHSTVRTQLQEFFLAPRRWHFKELFVMTQEKKAGAA